MIVTDPPYPTQSFGKTRFGMFNTKNRELLFKHNNIDVEKYAGLLFKVLKNGCHCYIMTNSYNLKNMINTFTDVGFRYSLLICWDKKNKIVCNGTYMQQCEFILFFRKGTPVNKVNNTSISNLISISNLANKKHGHPTEKPVDLMKVFVEQSSNKGDIVLDPFVGVGATAIACKETRRKFIGCELDKKYFKTTIKRLKENRITSIFR